MAISALQEQVKIQVKNSVSIFFEKKFKFLDFRGVVLVKTFPLMYQLLM